MTRQLDHHNDTLHIGGVSATTIATDFDTPCFVTELERIGDKYRALAQAFAAYPTTIAYACKANTGLALMQYMQRLGASIDAVSLGEVQIALRAGFAPENIYFTGTNPRDDHLQTLLDLNVHINIDSLSIARRIAPLAQGREFGLRINPSVGAGHHEHVNTGSATSKFGLHADDVDAACGYLAEYGHQVTRLHAHIGSGIVDADPFVNMMAALGRTFRSCESLSNVAIKTIDIGGGFGIPYRPDDTTLDVQAAANAIIAAMDEHFPSRCQLLLEPGRYLVADSTVLLSRVTSIKPGPRHTYVGLDTGMHQLLRPALYQSYHHIVAAEKMTHASTHSYHFTGPICESADVVGADRELPELAEGDLVAICDAGAYGMTMASTYNSNPFPAEVLITNGSPHLARERGSVDDLLRGQHALPHSS